MELQLRRLRKRNDLTQDQLAMRINSTLRKISSWERGETQIPLSDAAKIADVLECSLDELAGRQWPADALDGQEQKLVVDYRNTHDLYKPEIEHYAEDQAQRHPKMDASVDTGRQAGIAG